MITIGIDPGLSGSCRFKAGDIVRQYHHDTMFDDAVVLHAHSNGALDVQSMDGKTRWGWTSSRCELVGFLA